MRIHLLSDLHFEFGKFQRGQYAVPDCDVVVLAGDIWPGVQGVVWAQQTFGDTPVLYIPGNHEFYGKRRYDHHLGKMRAKAAGSNVTVMNEDITEIESVRFLGCTLWTDFNLYGTEHLSQLEAQGAMNDYRQILSAPRTFLTAEDTRLFNLRAKFFLHEELRKPYDGKTVIITHHAPSELSIAPRYRDDPANPAYASRLESMMLDYGPELWLHGHTHNSVDYHIGGTRVVTNPRGHERHELNPAFKPDLVIEV